MSGRVERQKENKLEEEKERAHQEEGREGNTHPIHQASSSIHASLHPWRKQPVLTSNMDISRNSKAPDRHRRRGGAAEMALIFLPFWFQSNVHMTVEAV